MIWMQMTREKIEKINPYFNKHFLIDIYLQI